MRVQRRSGAAARWLRALAVPAGAGLLAWLAPAALAQGTGNNAPAVLENSAAGSPQSRDATTPLPAPPPPDHLFGNWNGKRDDLAKLGITYTLNYTTETAGVVAGGQRKGATYAHQVALSIDVDWETLANMKGFKTHAIFINRAGASVSPSFVGDTVLAAQEIYGAGFGQFAKLVWLYGEQSLLDDRLKIRFGRFAPGLDFAASPIYCSFMTLTICGHPRALTAEQAFVDWPLNQWGAQVKGRPTDTTYVSVGAFQSQPFPTPQQPYTWGGYTGFSWTFRGTTGVSIPVELGYEPLVGAAKLPGHYKVGLTFDSSDYRDNFFDRNAMPLALTGLQGRTQHGRFQFWATADQLVYQNGPYSDDGLYLLAAYARDDADTSLFRNFLWAGLVDRGIVPGRPFDQLGFGFTYYDVSPRLTRTERLQAELGQAFANGARGVQTYGTVYELNYQIRVGKGVLVQPEVEYFNRPGAVGRQRDALLFGLKTNVDF